MIMDRFSFNHQIISLINFFGGYGKKIEAEHDIENKLASKVHFHGQITVFSKQNKPHP